MSESTSPTDHEFKSNHRPGFGSGREYWSDQEKKKIQEILAQPHPAHIPPTLEQAQSSHNLFLENQTNLNGLADTASQTDKTI